MDAPPKTFDKTKIEKIIRSISKDKSIGTGFAWGQQHPDDHLLQQFSVKGVGDIAVPVSQLDWFRLKEASEIRLFGAGKKAVINIQKKDPWHIDVSQIKFCQPDLFCDNLPGMVSTALSNLGLDAQAMDVEAKLSKLSFYRAGERLRKHRCLERDPRCFALLVLQIPVEGGYRKGRLQVHHGGEAKLLDFTEENHTKFYYSVFYADCQYEFGKIQEGRRLTMTFELIRRGPITLPESQLQLPAFQTAAEELKELLTRWNASDKNSNVQRLLAFPLYHKYNEKNLTFNGLKGNDTRINKLLQSTGLLDVHLCVVTKYQRGVANKDELVFLDSFEEDYEETYTSQPWIAADGSIALFRNLNIDANNELLDEEERVFADDASPDRQVFSERGEDAENDPPILELWFEQPVMVFWPKDQSANMWMKHLPTAAELLEKFTKSEEFVQYSVPVEAFRRLLKSFEKSPHCFWNPHFGDRIIRRLTGLCVQLDARDEALHLLHLLADHHQAICAQNSQAAKRENQIVAQTIVELMKAKQWDLSGELFQLKSKSWQRLDYFVNLANHLLSLNFKTSAFNLLKQINHALSTSKHEPLHSVPAESVAAYAALLVQLDVETEELCKQQFIDCLMARLKAMDVDRLCSVLIEIHQGHGLNLKSMPSAMNLIRDLSAELVHKDLHSSAAAVKNVIVRVMECFLWIDDSTLLRQLTNAVCTRSIQGPAGNNAILQALLASDHLREILQSSSHGQYTLIALLIARITELSRSKRSFEETCNHEAESLKLTVIFVRMFRSIIALKDSLILADVTRLILSAPIAGNNVLLQTAVYSKEIREDLIATDEGRHLRDTMIKARIDELSLMKEPVFSWEQPNAIFHSDHPTVQEFFVSPRNEMLYSNFKTVTEARAFVRNHFGPFTISRHYSATSTVKKLRKQILCKITKTNCLHLHELGKYQLYQKELEKWQKFNSESSGDSSSSLADSDFDKPSPAKRLKLEDNTQV